MDSARERVSGDTVDAESLWDLAVVEKDGYECHGCGVQVWPASYEKGVNKKRPYFSLRTNKHITPCAIDGEEKYIARAQKTSIGSPEGFPLPFPNKLVLTDERPVVAQQLPQAHPSELGTKSKSPQGAKNDRYHGHTVKTLRPICRTFMRFPNDHAQLPLSIPGCEGNSFDSVFWRLGKITKFRNPTHLYFAPLQWKAPHVGEAYAEWTLDAGDWDSTANRRGDCYRVRVNWATWTPRQRDALRYEIEVARNEVKGVTSGPKAWLFCVGTQDDTDPTLILVNKYQLICCLVGEQRTLTPNRNY